MPTKRKKDVEIKAENGVKYGFVTSICKIQSNSTTRNQFSGVFPAFPAIIMGLITSTFLKKQVTAMKYNRTATG
ncbi:MAG: hypothetical protein ACJLTB_07250 [Algoriphagus aquaeductus]|uniref:hypothetical protein n=1 Tax=Algoriphagus aquaeductus TaxID=475299 RepID=UPI003879B19C